MVVLQLRTQLLQPVLMRLRVFVQLLAHRLSSTTTTTLSLLLPSWLINLRSE